MILLQMDTMDSIAAYHYNDTYFDGQHYVDWKKKDGLQVPWCRFEY